MYGSLIFYFDFFSQINNSEHFKACLPFLMLSTSVALPTLTLMEVPFQDPSIFWKCVWPLRVHLVSDLLFASLYGDVVLKPTSLGANMLTQWAHFVPKTHMPSEWLYKNCSPICFNASTLQSSTWVCIFRQYPMALCNATFNQEYF